MLLLGADAAAPNERPLYTNFTRPPISIVGQVRRPRIRLVLLLRRLRASEQTRRCFQSIPPQPRRCSAGCRSRSGTSAGCASSRACTPGTRPRRPPERRVGYFCRFQIDLGTAFCRCGGKAVGGRWGAMGARFTWYFFAVSVSSVVSVSGREQVVEVVRVDDLVFSAVSRGSSMFCSVVFVVPRMSQPCAAECGAAPVSFRPFEPARFGVSAMHRTRC